MMPAVAGAAAHVGAIVSTAVPGVTSGLFSVAAQACRCLRVAVVGDVLGLTALDVFGSIAVTRFAGGRVRADWKLDALAMESRRKCVDHFLVALPALRSLSQPRVRRWLRAHRETEGKRHYQRGDGCQL